VNEKDTVSRNSKQRSMIMEILKATKAHPNAISIYTEARKFLPNISLGTVYRNLKLLEEQGSIRRLVLRSGIEHYDYDLSPHHHFVCNDCGRVYDVQTNGEVCVSQQGFEVESCDVQFYGKCCDCCKETASCALN